MATQEVEQLVALAQRFATSERYGDAVSLLRIASRLAPEDKALPRLLAEIEAAAAPELDGDGEMGKDAERDTLDACHFFGLAMIYAERGELSAAIECAQMAKEKSRALPFPYKLHGRLLLQQKDFVGAARELQQAVRFNPFDRESAEILGQVEYERKNYQDSLATTVDAFLLLRDKDSAASSRLRRRIRTLKRVLKWDNRTLIRLFHDRQEHLSIAFDRLQWRRDLFLEERGLIEKGLFGSRAPDSGGERIALAGRLRRMELWSHLTDETIFQLTQVVHEENYEEGEAVFEFGSVGADMFFLDNGEIAIQRPTPYGAFTMRGLKPGDLFGEINFVCPGARSSDAIATATSQLLRVDATSLQDLVQEQPEVGVEIYSGLWHALAQKLRLTNELLRTFFPDDSVDVIPENVSPTKSPEALSQGAAQVDSRDKIRLFREQGLSRRELLTLATFSQERHYEQGTYLFREGDPGSEMYVVLDGQVRISKFIPGGGEEALTILGRGDFFGEIALIDGQPRSADARTHRGPVTVLVLDQATLQDVLAMDPQASLEFLELLCRILASRLRELDEKVVMWQILAGHQDSAAGELPA